MLQRTLQSCILSVAFFMPFFSHSFVDMTDLRNPKHDQVSTYKCIIGGVELSRVLSLSECSGSVDSYYAKQHPGGCDIATNYIKARSANSLSLKYTHGSMTPDYPDTPSYCAIASKTIIIEISDKQTTESIACPPVGSPDHIYEVNMDNGVMCGKATTDLGDQGDTDNDESCPKSSGFDLPELSFGATDSTSMCFPNPTNNGGSVCKYNSNNGVFQLPPNLGESVNCDTGEPDNQPPNPDDTDTPDADGCVTKMGQKYCEAKPEDNCKMINGHYDKESVLECGNNCGDIGGIFYCPKEEDTNDQIPDINDNCTDEVFRLANPTVCSGKTDDTTDKNGDGKVDNSDVVKGLNTNNQLAESTLAEIKKGNEAQTAEQKKLNEKSFATNQLLSSLNSKVSDSNALLKDIKDNTGAPTVESGFDPAKSTSFYERTYPEGIKGVWSTNEAALKQTEFVKFLDQFNPAIASSKPNTQFCFNLGALGNFGCKDLPLPDAALLAILKIIILVTAAFACRSIVFGG